MKYNLNMNKVNFDLAEKHLQKENFVSVWNGEKLQDFLNKEKDKPLFLLHDGPPYANGDLHLGHFTNKVLKDTLLKFKRLNGFYAPFYNGSDCHGLPVELAVEKSLKKDAKSNKQSFVKECYVYSDTQVENQMSQLKGFGVLADFNNSYKTTHHHREAGEMQAVLSLLEKGYLFQKYRPVYWCKDCQSSLAEAELEYMPKVSDSLTVEFKVLNEENTFFLVWTTTPYTLPANQAVAYNKKFTYAKYFNSLKNKFYVQLKLDETDSNLEYVEDFNLENRSLESPYHKKEVNLYHADFVESAGTGFVHVAPSFGLDDFHLGELNNLETNSYVNEYGKFNTDDFPELYNMNLKDAGNYVMSVLNNDNLVYEHKMFEHEYPHCWRHKTPLFSKTSQEWFMDLSKVKEKAKEKLSVVQFFPENGRNRLSAMLEGRSSWCVSRNRVWGVPLPHDTSEQSKEKYKEWAKMVEKKGLSSLYEDENFKSQTLDVWFDSGMTHTTVVKDLFGFTQSDLYLEGTDQHRGWFQSSLLTSLALNDETPYKQVLTHGFVVDDKGKKFSKSLGNYVSMEDLLKEYSPDVLRVWALGQDYHKELTYSKANMNGALEKYKKFRNTFRFMLQNLADFNPSNFVVSDADLVDNYVLYKTNELKNRVLDLGNQYKFNEALTALHGFCDQLSVVYLDSQKDRLYCLDKNDNRRLLTQSVLYYVQHTLMLLLSAYLPYSMEEYYNKLAFKNKESVFMEKLLPELTVEVNEDKFNELLDLKLKANKLFEEKRENKLLSKNNEMFLYHNSNLNEEESKALSLLLGNVYLFKSNEFKLEKHSYLKCDRCWNYFEKLSETKLCEECFKVENS